jgi:hypothetical protein
MDAVHLHDLGQQIPVDAVRAMAAAARAAGIDARAIEAARALAAGRAALR